MQPELKVELGFVQRRLPWIIGAGAFLVYLITLSYGPTFEGIGSLAKAAGWDWRANVVAPLHVILTYPIRWLPAGIQLTALNLSAAVCASLALALLARSVALLPHDRTREQRTLERSDYSMLSIRSAWLPPVLAALVCGLQLSFWENAVVATGEALDLLIFAWLIHCLLQYRLDEKESRLNAFALVYGMAVANNYAMVWFFVPFTAAVIWIKGLSFFKWRFLIRTTLFGVAGLMLYLLLPALESLNNSSGHTFWELMKSYWGYQKSSLRALPNYIILLSSLTSLLPMLFVAIRWPAQFGETSALGNALTNLMTHVIHGVFLIACLYVAFDPAFSPRNLSGQLFALLPLYYLGALAVGYFSGYFLLVFGAKPGPQAWQRHSLSRRVVHYSIVGLVWAALVVVPVGLIKKNLPVIQANRGAVMKELVPQLARSLPEQGSFVLGDDVFQLYALKHELNKTRPNHGHVLIDTSSLTAAGYQRFQQRLAPERWPKLANEPKPGASVPHGELIQLVYEMSSKGPVFYLHPSFGYYFEFFYMKPHKAIYELKLYPTNSISGPALTAAELKEQDAFWRSRMEREIAPVIRNAAPFAKSKPGKARAAAQTLDDYLGGDYSRRLNHFGVMAQRSGDLEMAGQYFDWALQCNKANPAAFQNLEFNRLVRAGKRRSEKSNEGVTERLEPYGGRWDAILSINGPVDEPGACYSLAQVFEQGNNFRQAAQNLERALHFEPTERSAARIMALMCVKAMLPDPALAAVADYRRRFAGAGITEDEEMELLRAEAWAHTLKNDLAKAENLLDAARTKHPGQSAPWDTLVDIYLQLGRATNAVTVLEEQLKAQPDSVRAMVNFGVLNMRLGKSAEAMPYFDRALRLSPRNEDALYNRAMANQFADRVDAAIRDYEALMSSGSSKFGIQALYALAELQFRKKNRNESLRYYKDFLKAAPPGLPEIAAVKERIKLLESGASL